MAQSPYHWIREYGRRMDSSLRSLLIQRLQLLRYVPCIFHRTTQSLIHRLSRVPVLVQLEQNLQPDSLLGNTLFAMQSPRNYFSSIHTIRMNITLSQLKK